MSTMEQDAPEQTEPRRRAGEEGVVEAPPLVAVDLFCGVGGLTHGLVSEGVRVVAGFDTEESCRYAYEHNNPGAVFHAEDVSSLSTQRLSSLYPEHCVRVLVGCAPCQKFSPYGLAKAQEEDYGLLRTFKKLVEETEPDVVSMENVGQLCDYPVYDEFVDALKASGYHVWARIVKCADYGIPQGRKRLVLLASRLGPIALCSSEGIEKKSVRKAIESLPELAAGGVDPDDPLHRCKTLQPLTLRRMRATPEGGGWKDWPEDLRLSCHKKESGKTFVSVYGRMNWDDLAPTMTTQCCGFGNGRFGHPVQDRAISLREAAIFQSFPENYRFFGEEFPGFKVLEKQIGNAVPVQLGRAIARSVKDHVEVLYANSDTGYSDDTDTARVTLHTHG